jgi:lipoprotein-anchoring transpeptidase ErfK/SrfK
MRQTNQQTVKTSKISSQAQTWVRGYLRTLGLMAIGGAVAFAAINTILSASLTGVVYPGVKVAGQDMAFKTRSQVVSELKKRNDQHTLTIYLADKTYVMKSSELGATRDIAATADAAYSVGRLLSSARSGQTGYAYNLNSAQLNTFVSKVLGDIGRAPVNAKVEVVEGKMLAVADRDGVSIDQKQLALTLQQALAEGRDRSVELQPATVKADIRLSDTEPVINQANQLAQSELILTYEGKAYRPSQSTVVSWLVFPAKTGTTGAPSLAVDIDEAKVRGYVQSVANEINIVPTNKKVTIKNGVSTVDQEGKDGLAINQEQATAGLVAALRKQAGANLAIAASPVVYKTEYNRVTTLDVGRYIEINLSTQQLWVYQDSQVIYSSPITSGATGRGFPTVTGLFSIYSKSTNIWLDGRAYGENYNYRVLVDYWMPFHGGFGLHDAWRWRTSFGGSDYYYNGSHGCVNLPLATAAFIYNWADVGTPVWVHT